jgi:hypothetical protein
VRWWLLSPAHFNFGFWMSFRSIKFGIFKKKNPTQNCTLESRFLVKKKMIFSKLAEMLSVPIN